MAAGMGSEKARAMDSIGQCRILHVNRRLIIHNHHPGLCCTAGLVVDAVLPA
jgi:hypothetical protein